MNMKKTIGICATLLAALLCAVPRSAQATGKIRALDAYMLEGGQEVPFPMEGKTLTVGDTIYVRFRLANVQWSSATADHNYANPWEFRYTGTLTGHETLDELTQIAANKPRLGLWISGTVREAECVNFPMGTASDWLADVLGGERHYTDLVFAYTVQAGDIALPIQLANASGTGPSTGAEPYYLKCNGQAVPWAIQATNEMGTVTADFAFGPSNMPEDDPDFHWEANNAGMASWLTAKNYETFNMMDMTQAGVYVQAIDFDSTYFNENAGIWRSIAQGATTADPGTPALSIAGGAATPMYLYVWTEDPNIAEIVKGGQVEEEPVEYTFIDGQTRKVGRLHVYQDNVNPPFSIKATGTVGASTKVFLSAMPTNIWNAGGTGIATNFIMRTIQVGEPLPPSINVMVNGKTKETVTANADHSTALVSVDVTLSEAYPGGEFTIPLKLSVKEKPDLNAQDYVGMSQTSLDDNRAWDTTLTIPSGQTSSSLSLWMYANRGSVDTENNGILVEVDTNAMDTAARAFFTGKILPATVVVKRSTPEVLNPDTGASIVDEPAYFIRDAEAFSPKVFEILVADAYGELSAPCHYTVHWSNTGDTGDEITFEGLSATAAGIITLTNVVYTRSGDYTSKFYVVNEDGKASVKHDVAVHVAAQKLIKANLVDGKTKFPENDAEEQAIATFSFGEGGFSMPNNAREGYIFLVPRDENSSNLVESVDFGDDWKRGLRVFSDTLETAPILMTLLDGGNGNNGIRMSYDIVVRTAQNWDEGDIVSSWSSQEFTFAVTNVAPNVTAVMMGSEILEENGGNMGTVSLGVLKMFSAETDEPTDIDFYADEPDYTDGQKAFETHWDIKLGTSTLFSTNVFGPPTVPFGYTFNQAGTYDIEVSMRDKDSVDRTRYPRRYGSKFTFKVTVDAKPAVTLVPYSGLDTFYEGSSGRQYGRLNLGLTMVPSERITVHLEVSRAGTDDGNYPLPVLNTYDVDFGGTSGNTDSAYVWFDWLDGTPMGGSAGFVVTASVTTTTTSSDGVPWKDLYSSATLPVAIVNEKPQILTDPGTNEVRKAENESFTVPFRVQDVPADMAAGLTATWTTSEGERVVNTITATGVGQYVAYSGTSPTFAFTSAGHKMVTLYLEDKEREYAQQTWYFYVLPSKALYIYPHKPRRSGETDFADLYTGALGLGDGRVWATGGAVVDFSNFIHKYTFDPTVPDATVYARGYKVGDVDDGTLLPGTDIALTTGGSHNKNGTPAPYYVSNENKGRDSFFYCWILDVKGEGAGGGYMGSLLSFKPARSSDDDAHQLVGLPEYEEEQESYDPTVLEAIFSKELYPADNMGDINQDGVPDYFAVSHTFGRTKLYAFAGGGDTGGEAGGDAADLDSLADFNGDGDRLPADSMTTGNILITADSWTSVGEPFTADLEIRGFHNGLNYREDNDGLNYRVLGKWVSVPTFSPAESNAIVYVNKQRGIYEFTWPMPDATNENYAAAVRNWTAGLDNPACWIPENRTDPTTDDTDKDGFSDGYEYFFWYLSQVGWIDDQGEWKRLEGERFQLEDIAKGVPIPADEIAINFNPTVKAEVIAGVKPVNRDTDGDGLTDLEELTLGTNPVHWDTDGDGMSDLWEILRGMNPLKVPDPTKKETNLDGDYMASWTSEKIYSVMTFTSGVETVELAMLDDASAYIDPDTGALREGVSNLTAIAVYRYGGDGSVYTPVSRGAYGKDESISYFGRAGSKRAGSTWGDIRIVTDRPMDTAEVDVSGLTFVSFATNQAIRLVHDQVYAQFGFDPRTAWHVNKYGYVADRWRTSSRSSNVHDAGMATNTVAYSCFDEYLVLKYRYRAKSAGEGEPLRSLSDDLAKIASRQQTLAAVFMAGTTNPNVPFDEVSYNTTPADSGEDGSSGTVQGATVPTYTSTNHGADTDEDGVPDGWELYVMFNPNDSDDAANDGDGDRLSLAAEYAGTDSSTAYDFAVNAAGVATIYDLHPGLANGWYNKFFPTDPWDIDTDGDGVSDHDEGDTWSGNFKVGKSTYGHTFTFIYGEPEDDGSLCIRGGGLNPCSVDTDGDLLPDPWERDFAGIVFQGAAPSNAALSPGDREILNRNDNVRSGTEFYITGGMDGTFGPRNAATVVGDAVTSYAHVDPRTGTRRNFDFDNDGLQNFQEYLVQTLRHLRYDDTETPLMGSYLPDGLAGTRTYVTFLPMQTWDGAEFFKTARAAGFTGLSAYGGEGFRYRDLGYFVRPSKAWDPVALDKNGLDSCKNYEDPGYRVMLRPAGLSPNADVGGEDRMPARSYASTDPRAWDTDGDGMDDYYELFHGLNPLLGKTDVISDAYAVSYGGAIFSAYYNAWVGWPMIPLLDPEYDAMKYPWFMGVAEADADGDGLRNTDEALLVNTSAPQNYHTDPTPLWMTDSSARTSFTKQYYGRDPYMTEAMAVPDMTSYFWFSYVDGADEGGVMDYMFSFEENEGFDTDHDWVPDGQELTHAVTSATDPKNGADPDRRQAIYLPGDNSALASYSGEFSRPVGENYAMLRQFTVEAWIRPDGVAADPQTIISRVSDYPNSTLSNAAHQVRANFRIAIDAEGRVYGQYDSDDAVPSGSANGFGTVTVRGNVLDTETWSHVALTFNGSALALYVNGRMVNSTGSNLIPANGIALTTQSVTPSTSNFGNGGYTKYPGAFLVGADAAAVEAIVLGDKSSWENYGSFYKGWVDEVRVWDGARTADQIAESYKKRYSFSDVSALRDEIYASWLENATRNENDGKPNLPAELLLHYSFLQLPSEVNADYVASEPSGFTEKVVDNVKWNGHSVDLRCGWWSAIPIASEIYANRALVPWIRNTCGMLPALDGSSFDSRYWSELLGGVTLPPDVDVTTFSFPNTACPYPYWNYMAEGYFRQWVVAQLVESVIGSRAQESVGDLWNRVKFEERTGFVGGADLLPLGGAFAKRCPDFWDGQGATDASTLTADDLDNDGLPDWWEAQAVAQYGAADAAGLTASTMVDYILPSGVVVRIPAWQAYQIDLARGMLPGGEYDDAYATLATDANGDGIPDWWQKMYGVFDADADDDTDNDGLSNYQEWLITWGDDYGYGLSNGFPLLDPTKMCSQSEEGINIVDYFAQSENPDYYGYYMGEIFTDHDFMEDLWEDAYSMDAVNRNRYDAHLDPDGDGWSNFAEVRSFTAPDKTATLSLVRADGSEDHALPAYPIPTVRATVANNSGEAFHSAIVVKAWKGTAMSGSADATWTVAGDGEASAWNRRFLGLAPNRKMKFNIGPGNISEHHVMLEFYDPNYYIETITYETNGTIKKIVYTPHNVDSAAWGTFYYGDDPADVSNGRGTGALPDGWVNYDNGDIEVDFASPTYRNTDATRVLESGDNQEVIYHYDLTRAFWRVRWMARLVEVGSVKKFSLCEAEEGYLREGKNTFVAFADLNGNGELDVGEPSGFARDVNVGFDCVNVEIALSSDAVAFDIPAQEEATDKTLVRVVRKAINGVSTRQRIVYSRAIDLTKGKTFSEADFVKSGEYDLDWNRLVTDADALAGVAADKISSVDYEVYVGEEGTNRLATFTRHFAGSQSSPRPTGACTNSGYVVSSAQPVLKWKPGVGYSAFTLQIAKDEDFTDIVYATTNLMPAVMVDGCTFKPDVYVGEELEDKTVYYWRVAQLNAKFRENKWSEAASFRTDIDSTIFETGYGRLAAEVRYFGPASVALSNVVVGVYEAADFASAPVARKRLTDSTATLTGDTSKPFFEVTANVMFDGIAPGSYYVMAFIDTNGNGVRDLWESWGYACGIGTDVTDRWSPVSFGVSSSKVAPSAALVVMEDTDVNQNWMPDCLEDMSGWVSPTEGGGSSVSDSDEDGLSDDLEVEFGTDADNWDSDGDGIPDGWEALFAETDPIVADAEEVAANDVMAYAVTNLTVVTTWNGLDEATATNKYVVADSSRKVKIGDDAAALADVLARTYDYAGKYGLGKVADAAELAGLKVYAVEESAEVVLVHAQVYEFFGYSPYTANPAVAEADAVNTKPFTALDKYLVCRYLEQAYGLADEVAMNTNGLWSAYTLKPGDADNDKDGVPDGWELYVMFGTEGVTATLPDALISPFNYDDARALAPAAGSELTLLEEFDGRGGVRLPHQDDRRPARGRGQRRPLQLGRVPRGAADGP